MVVFADWVSAYNTTRAHTTLAGRTPIEVWRSDPTPVRALEHRQARWMLLARRTRAVGKDGIQLVGEIHLAVVITVLRGAQVAFLLGETLLEIDSDAFAADHEAHAGAPATRATATLLGSYPDRSSPPSARLRAQPERTPTRSPG